MNSEPITPPYGPFAIRESESYSRRSSSKGAIKLFSNSSYFTDKLSIDLDMSLVTNRFE